MRYARTQSNELRQYLTLTGSCIVPCNQLWLDAIPDTSGCLIVSPFKTRFRTAPLGKRRLWIWAFFMLLFLSSIVEARPCKEPVCYVIAIACAGQPCRRGSEPRNTLREEDVVQLAPGYQPPLAYFRDEPPGESDLSRAPNGARELTIAKVRALDIPVWLGGRDQSGISSTKRSRDNSVVRIRIIEVRSGSASLGQTYEVYFGEWGRETVYPLTPNQLARDYIVAMYSDPTDGKYRLVGVPIGSAEYRDWMAERSEYWRSQLNK